MKCLDSLTPTADDWQLILSANGKPLSAEIVAKASSLTGNYIQLESDVVLTPGKARNLALQKAQGEWIFLIDDDAYALPGYWEKVASYLKEGKIDVLGGPDAPAKGMNSFATALSLALSSPFCTGTTFARHKSSGSRLQNADEEKLASSNLWLRKSVLEGVQFPEDYKRGEELYLLQKLKQEGKHLFYDPLLKVGHHRRTRLKELWRPAFYAGYYRSKLLKENLKKGNETFWLPLIFVLLHTLAFLDPMSFWYLVRMYVSIILFVSIALSMQIKRMMLFPLVAFLHYFIVFVYGTGFLFERLGLLRK